MKLLMIPFEDHFNNLMTFLLILITLTSAVFSSGQLNDYTFDTDSKCSNIELNLNQNTHKQGYIHSAFYYSTSFGLTSINSTYSKCTWILNAPLNHIIDLTLIDLKTQSPNTCLLIRSLEDDTNTTNIWISLENNNYNKNNNNKKTRIEFINQINTCNFNLKSFTKIETNLTRILIEFTTDSNVVVDLDLNKFLLVFNAHDQTDSIDLNDDICNNSLDDMKCTTQYDLNHHHLTCIPRNFICTCDLFNSNQTKCFNLFNQDDLAYQPHLDDSNCYYFLKLNNMCQNKNLISRLLDTPSTTKESVVNNQIVNVPEITLFKQKTFFNECVNQTLTNEYGWLASPGFINKKSYSSGLTCFYHVSFQHNQLVQIRFKYFSFSSNIVDLTSSSSSTYNDTKKKRNSLRMSDLNDANMFLTMNNKRSVSNQEFSYTKQKQLPLQLGRTLDYDHLTLFDGMTTSSPVLAHFNGLHNDFNRNFNGRAFNSKSNHLLIMFHTTRASLNRYAKYQLRPENQDQLGFNLTYQIKGLCIEDQIPCNSLYELNCYSRNQTCNDVWDCHNGADERGCGRCRPDQFRCRNDIFCYRLEDRCDGDHQCVDKSDELNCDSWFCNSDNGTFLCNNGRCIYEQWVCDGTNDCDDGSDEINCPTPFTRRVITTAVLGGTLCCLLLVMALGCACKLYSLHTVGYRNNIRLSQSVSAAAAAAAAASSVPLMSSYNTQAVTQPLSTSLVQPESSTSQQTSNTSNTGSMIYNNLATLFRRALNSSNTPSPTDPTIPATTSLNTTAINLDPPSIATTTSTLCDTFNSQSSNAASSNLNNNNNNNTQIPGELPQPHYLIAPPTYNQTMGLVDEYEQRQLAFIEHVRSLLLAQQQQQHQSQNNSNSQTNGLINLNTNTVPTATSSSTILHRVTSSGSSSGRRSHSSRHHRHHHHRSSSNQTDSTGSNSQSISNSNETRVSSHRHHRHHHHHHHHRHRTHHNQCINLAQISSTNQVANSLTQVNFDSNRRGLIMNQDSNMSSSSRSQRRSSFGLSLHASQTHTDQLQMTPAISNNTTSDEASSIVNASNPTTSNSQTTTNSISGSSSNNSSTFNSSVVKSQINLRDRIAKLIKDIVVHHGDNIQYVQLADQVNNQTSSTNSTANSPTVTTTINTNETESTNNSNMSPTITTQLSNSANVSQNGSEDDVPLIQP